MPNEKNPFCGSEQSEAAEKDGGMYENPPLQSVPWLIPEELRNRYFDWGDRVDLGAYPQSIRNRDVAINGEPDVNGCFSGDNGTYVKHNGAYFLIQPLQWDILNIEDEIALVVCKTAVACMRFDPSSGNYANSEIRKWLNGAFFETAFGEETKKRILKTLVDNSAASCGDSNGRTVCGNTYDNLFLLSVQDIDSAERPPIADAWASDYAEEGAEFIWLRSPSKEETRAFGFATPAKNCEPRAVTERGYIVPAMRISLRSI